MDDLAEVGSGEVLPEAGKIETEAREYGWRPEEEWRGEKDSWRPAQEFVEWSKKNGRLTNADFNEYKKQFPALREDNQKLKNELTEVKETLKQFSEFASKGEERAYKRAKAELESKLDTAIETADVSGARQVRKEIAELEDEKPKPPAKTETTNAPTLDPVIQSWIGENDWFNKSPALRGVAIEEFGDLEKQFPGKSKAELLAETRQKVMDRFPEKFGVNTMRENASAVTAPNGGAGAPKKKGKTYDDLPADAKVACNRFVRQIPGYTRENYVKDYEWES